MRTLALIFFFLLAPPVATLPMYAEAPCAATPQLAALQSLGASQADAGRGGFRVEDVQTDAVLHRAWVRVRRCDDAAAPLILVAFDAPAQAAVRPASIPIPVVPAAMAAATAAFTKPHVIHSGDSVRILVHTAAVQMELEGTAMSGAAAGDAVEVSIRRDGDAEHEPPQRMHGTARAPHLVEVQP